ncbi:WD repeat-containing protein 64-like isoform X2 [Halichondria panicea]|uniref:WD repeat-containing protein 64-like isoform X2 n=1 Tax=Halichondria panicea TaxID=6063 RepID=UPI00312B3EA6
METNSTSTDRPRSVRSGKGRRTSVAMIRQQLQTTTNLQPGALSLLVTRTEAQSKTMDEDPFKIGSRRDSMKQAWAPSPKRSLASRSMVTPGEPLLPPLRESRPPTASSSRPSSRVYRAKDGSSYIMMDTELKSDFGRAEDRLYLQDLEKLRQKFEEADVNGDGTLDADQFLVVFDKLFGMEGKGEEEILRFFNKIDYNCDNYIDWDEFCTYMHLEYQERDVTNSRQKSVAFHCPAQYTRGNPHNESLCRVTHLHDGSLVSCSVDGVICFWGNDLCPRRVRKTEPGRMGKPKWVTDMALCIPQGKILITTGDREIQFYEMMNFEPYCQLRRLESVPLKVTFWYNPKQHSECIILIGDREATLTVIMTKNIHEAFKYWKLGVRSEDGIPTYPVENLGRDQILGTSVYRWKLHSHWMSEIHYFPSLRCFASCSSDPSASLVLGSPSGSTPVDALLATSNTLRSTLGHQTSVGDRSRPSPPTHWGTAPTNERTGQRSTLPARNRMRGDQRVFKVLKGVSTVDYCHKNNALVTGSTDQIIRIWNPFINTKPVAHLFGQGSPVFSLKVDSEEDRIYSVGNDNAVRVWHILDHTCLCSVTQSSHKILSTVQAFHFNSVSQLLAIGTDQLAVLKLVVKETRRGKFATSHAHPITAVKFSHCFDQLVTACEGAVVKAWDVFTGAKVFEFSCDQEEDGGISALDVDQAGKRVVTGSQNGRIKVWNYNNGQCVRVLDKGNSCEVTDINFITTNNNKYIISVGWDRKISLFPDVPAKPQQISQLVHPLDGWSRASDHAHSDDILCVAFGSPHLMATASYDGEIIVWSVVSCHALSHLKATPPHAHTSDEGSEAVYKLLFLNTRARTRIAASLVASGPSGYVHFWNLYEGRAAMGRFRATRASITAMTGDSQDTVLFTAESHGHVCVWSIADYCVISSATSPPKRVALWKAHTDTITCLELIEGRNVLVSAAADGAVRLWSLEGHYIGSFGQPHIWTLGDPSSYQYPLSPEDITLDPTLPSCIDHNKETKSLEILLDSPPDKCDEQDVGVVSNEVVGRVSEECDVVTDVEDVIQWWITSWQEIATPSCQLCCSEETWPQSQWSLHIVTIPTTQRGRTCSENYKPI